MRSRHAGLFAMCSTLAAASIVHASPVKVDPASLGTPLVSPPFDVRLEGQPAMLGIQCDDLGASSTSHDPMFEWRLTGPVPSLRITIVGARAAVRDLDGNWICSDAHGELVLTNAKAGDYRLYPIAQADRATVTLRFVSPPRVKQVVEWARDQAPELKLGAASRPNPQIRALAATKAGQARDLHFCTGDREVFMPIARVTVTDDLEQLRIAELRPRKIGGHPAALQLVDSAGKCVSPGAVKAGSYSLWAEIDGDRAPASFPIELDDPTRPLAWADAPELDLAKLAEPLVIDGKIDKPEPRPTRATTRCKPVADRPSFYLTAEAAQAGVNLVRVWSRRPQWFLIEGPGLSTCSEAGAPITFDAVAGKYAVWAGGDPGGDFMFLVHRNGATINPLTTYVHPPADVTLAERTLTHFYPFFDTDADAAAAATALFAVAPERLFVYAAVDVGPEATAPKAGEPLVLRALDRGGADVLTYDGRTVHAPVKALTTTRPRTVTLPADADANVRKRFGL